MRSWRTRRGYLKVTIGSSLCLGIPLDWLVRAELDPASNGNLSLASLYQADAGGDCLVGRDAGHGDRVPRGGQWET